MEVDISEHSQMPPLHQKRILAFVNQFLISSTAFLSTFVRNSEARFIELERKIQKVEAALTIVEAKLASINDPQTTTAQSSDVSVDSAAVVLPPTAEDEIETPAADAANVGCVASEDVRYKKFFKMVQFGVHPDAVKMKMRAEGLDASVLDAPNAILTDGQYS